MRHRSHAPYSARRLGARNVVAALGDRVARYNSCQSAGAGHMTDAWLELLRLGVMGAVGLGGAWLGAQAAQRKERWGHRREVYQPILLALMDLHIHSAHRLRLEEEPAPADPKS